MKKFTILLLFFSILIHGYSQNSSWLRKTLDHPDKRFTFQYDHYYSSGGMGSNYEEIRYLITNNTSNNYDLTIEATVQFTCNRSKTYTLGINKIVELKPNATWNHRSDWVHLMFTNWSKKECLIKIDESKYTTIEMVSFNIIKVINKDTGESSEEISNANTQNNQQTIHTNNTSSNNTNMKLSSNSSDSNCPPQEFVLVGVEGPTCASFRWLSEAVNTFDSDGNFVQKGVYSDQFIFQYKPKDELYWKEVNIDGYTFKFSLTKLDPCTSYEVKLLRVCGSERSQSRTITFTTKCPIPMDPKAINITTNSADISSMWSSNSFCMDPTPHPLRILEYKTEEMEDWIVKVIYEGEKCSLKNLMPDTNYNARLKYQYEGDKISEPSKIVNFNTLKL